jgi:hypothetical protein
MNLENGVQLYDTLSRGNDKLLKCKSDVLRKTRLVKTSVKDCTAVLNLLKSLKAVAKNWCDTHYSSMKKKGV